MKLAAQTRTKPGSNAARRLRRQHKVPACLYGAGDSVAITLERKEVDALLASHERMVDLELDGTPQQSLVIDVQFDTFGADVLHLDFKRVTPEDEVHLSVALRFTGSPAGLLQGGITDYHLVDLEIRCKAKDIPTEIVVPIEHLELGDVLHIREVPLPPGIEALAHPGAAVVQIVASKKLKTDEAEVADAEALEADESTEAEGS